MRNGMMWMGIIGGLLGAPACESGAEVPDGVRTSMAIQVAALNLVGVGDVVWDLEVVNGRQPAPDLVWRQRISSSRYGDGRGSATYVGPCDASPDLDQNTVRLWVVGVYAQAVPDAALGGFGAAPPTGALDFQNPTAYDAATAAWAPPLKKTTRCEPNVDALVQFDVTLMRPALQGFFDIAVNFSDVFCSAKFDCCVENATGTACERDIALLHDGAGSRNTTFVLGFACSGGAGAGAGTTLYLDALELDCSDPAAGFAADIVIEPTGGAGNLCATAGDASTCGGVSGATAGAHIFQIATYRGLEQLTSGGVPANKVYWNVALGVKRPAIASCRLRTRGTADAIGDAAVLQSGTIPAGAVYPFVQWDVDLASCKAEPLGFEAADMVRTRYTATEGGATSFAYGYGTNLTVGPAVRCGIGGIGCPSGFVCTAMGEGASYDEFCWNAVTDEVFVPPGTFWMGCNPVNDPNCVPSIYNETPQHHVTLSGHAVDRTEVTVGAYTACVTAGSCTPPPTPPMTYSTFGQANKVDHPVNTVSWYQAAAYCAWPGKTAGAQRLCTEAEWERAARGGCETTSGDCKTGMRRFPWGAVTPTCDLANHWPSTAWDDPDTNCEPWSGQGLFGGTGGAGSRPAGASPYGTLDMSGNVWEWVADWYWNGPYPSEPQVNPTGPQSGMFKVIRGGSFFDNATQSLTATRRETTTPDSAYDGVGFRCCRTIP